MCMQGFICVDMLLYEYIQHLDMHGVYELKPPFIKVEDMSYKYRPLFIDDMKNWPMTIQDYVDYFAKCDQERKN